MLYIIYLKDIKSIRKVYWKGKMSESPFKESSRGHDSYFKSYFRIIDL